jgi:predicted RNase H-like nuclease (RuvC/YqgF family)
MTIYYRERGKLMKAKKEDQRQPIKPKPNQTKQAPKIDKKVEKPVVSKPVVSKPAEPKADPKKLQAELQVAQAEIEELEKENKRIKEKLGNISKERTKVIEAVEAKRAELEKENRQLKGKLNELSGENKQLKEKLDSLPKKPIKIFGWSLVQRKAGGGDNMYWYAGKSVNGKMKWIYLGRELDLKVARAKIEEREKVKGSLIFNR